MRSILITGSDGFIGSEVVRYLMTHDFDSMIHQYDISNYDYKPLKNIDYYDVIVHMGAISETNASESQKVLDLNILHTLNILTNSRPDCKVIYASSASVYGLMTEPVSETSEEKPNSLYALSKLTIDNIVRNFLPHKKCIGLRFFNVCSFDKESHKKQPSPTFSFSKQLRETGQIKLFPGSYNISRDFIFIDDVVKIIQFFIDHDCVDRSEIFNVGSGVSTSFETIADAMINRIGYGDKVYIARPDNLTSNYQTFTQANIDKLRLFGYREEIPSIMEYINGFQPN